MKYKKKLCLSCMLLLLCIFFVGCISNGKFYTFGERQMYIHNIGTEYYQIAEEYARLKKYDKAIIYYKKCLEFKVKTENELRYSIAYYSALSKKWEDAIENYKFLLKQDTNNRLLKKSLAYAYAMNDDIVFAKDVYSRLYQEEPLDVECVENYIKILVVNEDMELAKSMYEEYVLNFPDIKNKEEMYELVYPKKM